MKIIRATHQHIELVASLFDQYRVFYQCPSDLALARHFIAERIEHHESVIFLAMEGEQAVGFTQLYPSFCSLEAAKIFVLYDLFVAPSARKQGVAIQLMNTARDYAREDGAKRLDLDTHETNIAGQHLYEKLGYKRVLDDFIAYSLWL